VRRTALVAVVAAVTLSACGDDEGDDRPTLSDSARTARAEAQLRDDLKTISPPGVGRVTKVGCEKITDDTFLCDVGYRRGEDVCVIEIDEHGEADETGCRSG
jgi:hypothetical protein